jgi:iron complex outermembrane receptor protein
MRATNSWWPAVSLVIMTMLAAGAQAQTVEELRTLSIEQLANIRITSVLKSAEALSDAPAAVFVISREDILRSGARRIPEMLRLAPNLHVAQLGASAYAITARGFNVSNNASLSNKLLVMIDGRSVYSPLFGGVYWDMQEVLPENIERIEVISGPGAALWGANAVNGVINIITRDSAETQGGLLTLGAGNLERGGSLQYGGRLAPDLTYRLHVEGMDTSAYQTRGGNSARDRWSQVQGGFRMDWAPQGNRVSVQGDLYAILQQPDGWIKGRNVQARWTHEFADGSSVRLQAFYEQAGRYVRGGAGFLLDTYDIEVQHSFRIGTRHSIVWGAGERSFSYDFRDTALALAPPKQTLNLANVFVQDTIALTPRVDLTLGVKLEDEPYVGIQVMPSARLSWKVTDDLLLWTAVSRAVRSPTPVDVNLREFLGPTLFLSGSDAFRPERLTAYEAGLRMQASPRVSFSVSAFYNVYDHLRSIEPSATLLPLKFGNLLAGLVYGAEFWGSYRVTDWWQLTVGATAQQEHLHFRPGSSQLVGLAFAANDPKYRASLGSMLNLGDGISWWAHLRYVGALPHPPVPGYLELNTRLSWAVTDKIELSLAGYNLLHARHMEFLEAGVTASVPRSFFVETRVRF